MNRCLLWTCTLIVSCGAAPLLAQPAPPPPSQFVDEVTNPYFPLEPGTTYYYAGTDGSNVVEVTHNTRVIIGVTCTEVRDRAYDDEGLLVEDTLDWYAQDRRGNVWYFGEDTVEFIYDEDGNVVDTSTAGTWIAGEDGAKPGYIMLARPAAGNFYQQEVAPGVAEDEALVLGYERSVTVEYGRFRRVLVTEETTPLLLGVAEHKLYARGIGLIRTEVVEGGDDVSELVAVTEEDEDDEDD